MTTTETPTNVRTPIVESEACAQERRNLKVALGLTEEEAQKLNISEEDGYSFEDVLTDVENLKKAGFLPKDFQF